MQEWADRQLQTYMQKLTHKCRNDFRKKKKICFAGDTLADHKQLLQNYKLHRQNVLDNIELERTSW